MTTNLDYINQICIDLGGVGGHFLNISGENEICTLLGGVGGHHLEINALNEICTLMGKTAGHSLNLSALNVLGESTFINNFAAWKSIQEGTNVNYEPEVLAYELLLTVPLSAYQKSRLNVLVKSLKTGLGSTDLSQDFDQILILDSELPELKNLARNSNHPTTANSPIHTQLEGWKSNNIDAYINLQYNPTLHASAFKLNSASMGVFSNTESVNTGNAIGAYTTGGPFSYLLLKSAANTVGVVNQGGTLGTAAAAVASSKGLFAVSKTEAGISSTYQDDTLISTRTNTVDDMNNCNFFLLARCRDGVYNAIDDRQFSFSYIGRGFSQAEITVIKNAVYVYRNTKQFADLNILAVTGQSNAIGYYPEDVLPSNYNSTQDNIRIRFVPLTGLYFDKMNPAINCGYDSIAVPGDNTGWGCEQSFAHNLLTTSGKPVMVVKSGINGGAVTNWDAGQSAYTELESGLISASKRTSAISKLAVAWLQGEHEAGTDQTTAYYEAKIRNVTSRPMKTT